MVKNLGSALAACLLFVGCTDGPFYAIKRANPYFQAELKRDRALGPTFEDRLQELELLKTQLASMSAAEQASWASRLSEIIMSDPSPEMRAQAVRAIALTSSEQAVRALNSASADEVEKVRLAACKAWMVRRDAAARDMLLSLATKAEETTSVRQAAIESLSAFDEEEVRATLARLLDDRSPAVQHQVVLSLKTMTDRDYGGDFESWKQYLAGQNPPEPDPKSFTTSLWESLPSWR